MIINSNSNNNQDLNNEFIIKMEDCNNNLNSLLNKNVSMLYQQSDFKSKFAKRQENQVLTKQVPTCASCHLGIDDKYIFNVMNMYWHEECLSCSQCSILLNQSCFFKNGNLFCKDDYFKNFGSRCNSCMDLIGPNELVMRIDTPHTYQQKQCYYHLNCFKCLFCDKQLQKGDEYVLRPEGIYCKYDFEKNLNLILSRSNSNNSKTRFNSSFSASPTSTISSLSSTSLSYSNMPGLLTNMEQAQLQHNSQSFSPHLNPLLSKKLNNNSNSSYASGPSEEENSLDMDTNKSQMITLGHQVDQSAQPAMSMNQQIIKKSSSSRRITKRPRTILNAAQRYDFREAFKQSPKPCRKVREHLADKTGLSVRVVQVWFQNERAKMKKMQRRQQQQQQMSNGGIKTKLDKAKRKKKNRDENDEENNSDDDEDDSMDEDESDIEDDDEVDEDESLEMDENETDEDSSKLEPSFVNNKRKPHNNSNNFNLLNSNHLNQFDNNLTNMPVPNQIADNYKHNLNMNLFNQEHYQTQENEYNNLISNQLHTQHIHQHQAQQAQHQINPIDRLYSMQNSYFCSS